MFCCLFDLMLYIHGKQLRSCWDGQLLNHTVPRQASQRQFTSIKGTATLMISMFFMKELSEPWISIPVSSKSVEKYGSYGRLNI